MTVKPRPLLGAFVNVPSLQNQLSDLHGDNCRLSHLTPGHYSPCGAWHGIAFNIEATEDECYLSLSPPSQN